MKKRIDHIFKLLQDSCAVIGDKDIENGTFGVTSSDLEKLSGYSRSNISRDLTQLVKAKKIIRIGGRPVHFISRELPGLKKYSAEKITQCTFQSMEELIDVIAPLSERAAEVGDKNAFSDLIGADKSMKNQIKQAVAGILYPPNGLSTLLIGETGVGKTTFANTMHRFALNEHAFSEDAPYVVFNCADYSGNPQLLLSHLFGHAKGAFTGAEKETEGLVAQADGGILFLDEIHRLPPEGQEMLFSLMDRGEYRRLGESSVVRKANVMIIAATTEDPQEAILQTFLRRIPNVIRIPSLRERSIEERLELIQLYFKSESKVINRPVKVSTDVANALLFYECTNNLGQLVNDIKLSTASAFSESLAESKQEVTVSLANLPKHHFDFFDILEEQRKHDFDWQGKEWLSFNPNEAPESIEELVSNMQQESDFYRKLERNSKNYFEKGLGSEDIRKYIDEETMKYFGADYFGRKHSETEKPIYKIIPENQYTFLKGVIVSVLGEHGIILDDQSLIGLLIHLKNVIGKVQDGSYSSNYRNDVKKSKSLSYQMMAEKIVSRLNAHYGVSIPTYETSLLALFLDSLDSHKEESKVGILVITHGNSSGKDMADVANHLLQVDHAHGLCLPLDETVGTVLKQAIETVRQIDEGKGVLLLVDMGSLTNFSEIIKEETGIETALINCVSTPHVLEATRLAVGNTYPLTELVEIIKDSGREYRNVRYNKMPAVSEDILDTKTKTKVLKLIEETTTFINVIKVSKILEEAYHLILERTGISHSSSLYIKYMFHTVSMLERAIQKNALTYYNFDEKISEFEVIYTIVQEAFKEVQAAFGIEIDKGEIAYVAEIFYFADFQVNTTALPAWPDYIKEIS